MIQTKRRRKQMSNRNKIPKGSKYEKKMVLAAFSPVGAPRSCKCERYLVSYGWIDEISRATSEQGGENHAR